MEKTEKTEAPQQEQTQEVEQQPEIQVQKDDYLQPANEAKLFGKWDYQDIIIDDLCFKDYIAVTQPKFQVYVPHTAGRYQIKRFRKAQCPIVERLVGSIAYHGRNTGKKVMSIRIVKHAFEIINLMTGRNPIEILIGAIINSAPREDSTRIGSAGVVRKQAVDVSPLRRVNVAIYFITTGARNASIKNLKSVSECLADEIINAEKKSPNSYAVKKTHEIENVAKGNR